jgi:hypothetical protein
VATVNVATAEYALSILGQSVVAGTINGSGHLILERDNGETFDAGDFSTAITTLINSVIAASTLIELLVSANAVGDIPLRVRGMASQTGDLQQWQNNAAAVLGRITSDGKLKGFTLEGITLDGDLNTLSDINAAKIDGKKVTVNTVAPSSPAAGDIWINPSGS